ncbi:hypothetical protein QBC41DRAFT_348551 [Cercophora samala]|uniref:Uncharacterized protein n=1 Tax=Cercophora samala TaxID=330535 RepID=A0AA39Z9K6_9PEZI|nr:hypothetical protein QBC41DRAFT_348551 [Cercophora samala]
MSSTNAPLASSPSTRGRFRARINPNPSYPAADWAEHWGSLRRDSWSEAVAREHASRTERERLGAMRANPCPGDPFVKMIRREDWERVLPTRASPPSAPARALSTSPPEDWNRLPRPRYSWFRFGSVLVPERKGVVFAGAATSVLGNHPRDSEDGTDDENVEGFGAEWMKRRRESWMRMKYAQARVVGWIAAVMGLVKQIVGAVGDKLTVAAFMMFISVLWAAVMVMIGMMQVVGQVWRISYGSGDVVIKEKVDGVDRQRPAFMDINVDAMAGRLLGQWKGQAGDVVAVEAEAVETFRGRLQSLATRHPGRRGGISA